MMHDHKSLLHGVNEQVKPGQIRCHALITHD